MIYKSNREAIRRKLIDSCFDDSVLRRHDTQHDMPDHYGYERASSRNTAQNTSRQKPKKADCYSVIKMGPEHAQQQREKLLSNSLDCSKGIRVPIPPEQLQKSLALMDKTKGSNLSKGIMIKQISTKGQGWSAVIQNKQKQFCNVPIKNVISSMSKRVMLRLNLNQPYSQTKNEQNIPQSTKVSQCKEFIAESDRKLSRRKSGINLTTPQKLCPVESSEISFNKTMDRPNVLRSRASRQSAQKTVPCLRIVNKQNCDPSCGIFMNIQSICTKQNGLAVSNSKRKLNLTDQTLHRTAVERVPTITSTFINTLASEI